jgi:hypothetical protein
VPDRFRLALLLRATAEAHHAYEAELGRPDPNWVEWYAQFMIDNYRPGPPEAASARPMLLGDM